MTKLNISQAAKTFGKDRKTIQSHIKKGKLSCDVDGNGHKLIDMSELVRVYGESNSISPPSSVGTLEGNPQQSAPISEEKISMLERTIEELRQDKTELKQRLKEEGEEHRRREEKWDSERERFWKELASKNLLLEDKREREKPEEQERKSSDRWLVWVLSGFTLIVGATAMVAI